MWPKGVACEENDKKELKEIWEHTQQVTDEIKKALSKNDELTNDDYKTFCQDAHLNKKLIENDQYQLRYIVLGSVCYRASDKQCHKKPESNP